MSGLDEAGPAFAASYAVWATSIGMSVLKAGETGGVLGPGPTDRPLRTAPDPRTAPGGTMNHCKRLAVVSLLGTLGLGGPIFDAQASAASRDDLTAPGNAHRAAAYPDQLPRRLRQGAQLDLRRRVLQRPAQREAALLQLGHRRKLRAEQAVRSRRACHGARQAGARQADARIALDLVHGRPTGSRRPDRVRGEPGTPADVQSFQSRPDLHPPAVIIRQPAGGAAPPATCSPHPFSAQANGDR